MSVGRLLAIGGAAGPDLLARFVSPSGPAIVVVATASAEPEQQEAEYARAFAPAGGPIALAGAGIHVLPAGCTFELSGRRPSIVDAHAGERGRAA